MKKSAQLVTNPVNANVVKHTFQIDGDGYGTLQIAHTFNKRNIPTPSLSLHEFSLKNEIDDKSKYTDVWNNPYMCRILMNATYLRNLNSS